MSGPLLDKSEVEVSTMPYNVIKRGTKFVVQKQDGSKSFGTHDTEADAKKQLAALYASERSAESRSLHLLRATGQPRNETIDGRVHLIVPCIALQESVIHAVNSAIPEMVPLDTLKAAAKSWDGKPVLLGHPIKEGKQIPANSPGIFEAHGLGRIRNPRVEGTKLLMDACLDPTLVEKVGGAKLLRHIQSGQNHIEVSVGAYVHAEDGAGEFGGRKFKAIWRGTTGDHLALLPNSRGACSVEAGCGTHRMASRYVAAEGFRMATQKEVAAQASDMMECPTCDGSGTFKGNECPTCDGAGEIPMSENPRSAEASIIDPNTLRCLRNIPQSARDKMSAADFAGPDETYPISTQADVDAAKRLIGKAADPEAVKRKIIAIAKRKGLTIPAAWRAAQDGDTPEQEASEEAAELIAYQTIETLLQQVGALHAEAMTAAAELIADEDENPTETAAEEEAEEEVETARLVKIQTLCSSMNGSLYAVMSLTRSQLMEDNPGYVGMEARGLLGKRHSQKDVEIIQGVHDQMTTLGARCDVANMKMAETTPDTIRAEGGLFVVWSKDGTRRLGAHATREAAEVHREAIARSLARQGAACGCNGHG